MAMLLKEIVSLVGGQLKGDGNTPISGASIIRDVRQGEITFVDSDQAARQLASSAATAVVAPAEVEVKGLPCVIVSDAHVAFAQIVETFRPRQRREQVGVSAHAYVDPSARIGKHVVIHPQAWVDADVTIEAGTVIHAGARILSGSRIGASTVLYPNVVLYENSLVGSRVIIHAGAVIGAHGFGYHTHHGRHERSAQLGYVEIGDDVEIGAGTTIDRGTYGPTTIGEGTKIDNLVQVAHNCRIGRHNLICSQVGVAGSCVTGDYVVMAGQVGLRDHIEIGNQAVLGAKSGVMHDIPEGGRYVGIPATPERDQMVKQAAWAKLPEMRKELKALQKQLARLEASAHGKAA